jgi:hypothetical protein
MARKLGQIIARTEHVARPHLSRTRSPDQDAQILEPDHPRPVSRGAAIPEPQASAAGSESHVARGGHYPQPIPRPMAGNVGQAEAPSQNLPRLRVASPALHPPGSGHALDRHDRADGHARALRAVVLAWIVSADHRVHERGAWISVPA